MIPHVGSILYQVSYLPFTLPRDFTLVLLGAVLICFKAFCHHLSVAPGRAPRSRAGAQRRTMNDNYHEATKTHEATKQILARIVFSCSAILCVFVKKWFL